MQANSHRYPSVSGLTGQVFSIPATSCLSERVFSSAWNIVSKKRAQLKPKHAEMLVFLYEKSTRRHSLITKDSASLSELSSLSGYESEDSDSDHDMDIDVGD